MSSPELPNASAASDVPEDIDMAKAIESPSVTTASNGDEEMAIDGELSSFWTITTNVNFLFRIGDIYVLYILIDVVHMM